MNLYAVALIAEDKDQEHRYTRAGAVNADNATEAMVLALELCLFYFPTAQGHFNHCATLYEIPLEMIENGLA